MMMLERCGQHACGCEMAQESDAPHDHGTTVVFEAGQVGLVPTSRRGAMAFSRWTLTEPFE